MSYKPKYCCQCKEKIEQSDWRPWKGFRHCQLCETDYGIHDKIPWFIALTGILIGTIGIGISFRTPNTANVAPNQFISKMTQNVNKPAENQSSSFNADTQTQNRVQENNAVRQTMVETAKTEKLTTKKPETASNPQQESVYICGATTKKGTPCSRRVRGGGRCWQHSGQPAMLPQEKLLISNN